MGPRAQVEDKERKLEEKKQVNFIVVHCKKPTDMV